MDQLLIRRLPGTARHPFYIVRFDWELASCDFAVTGCNGRTEPLRVIAGQYRSRPLRSLRGMDLRPTADRLRETLFNVLTAGNPAALKGTVWLDLFAGTGAVGIEALSRGARQIYFFEAAPTAAKLIEENLHSLGIVEGYKILRDDLL